MQRKTILVECGSTAALVGGALWEGLVSPPAGTRPVREEPVDLAEADDRMLVTEFVHGRREAFDEIVRRHRQKVYHLCYRFTGNHDDAADAAQDAFVRAFRGLARFKHDSSLGTWLYRVAVNVCLNRAATRRPASEPLEGVERADGRVPDPLESVARKERAAAVRDAIRRLPPRQRATVVLRIYHELSHEEIAGVLGGTVGAAKANLFHALGNLRRLLRT